MGVYLVNMSIDRYDHIRYNEYIRKEREEMKKEITIFVYDNTREGGVHDHLIMSENGGDCAKMQVLLPEGWDAYKSVTDTVIVSPSGCKYSVYECMKQDYGQPKLFGRNLEVVTSERVSRAMTL